jgi:hypothetical protein
MRAADLKYIAPIEAVSIEKVGKLLNTGIHHRVYHYGTSKVIKIPRKRFNFLYSKRSHLESDIKLLDEYFPGLAVKTEVFSNANHSRHCIVQKKTSQYEMVTPKAISLIRDELNCILRANARLLKERQACLDFIGGEGFVSCLKAIFFSEREPYFSNMVIVKKKRKRTLLLLDSELIRLQQPQWKVDDVIRFFLCWTYFLTVLFWMKLSYGVNILKRERTKE